VGTLLAIVGGKDSYEKNSIDLFAGAGAWDARNGLYSAATKGDTETAWCTASPAGAECGRGSP
jgi:hypothetical protein